jgi:predicted nucleotidyltransferase
MSAAFTVEPMRSFQGRIVDTLPEGLNLELWSSLPISYQPEVILLIEALRDLEDVEGFRLQELWLFGSRARGDNTQDSDLDLLVIIDDGFTSPNPRLQARRAIVRAGAHIEYDLVLMDRTTWEREKHNRCTILPDVNRERRMLYAR